MVLELMVAAVGDATFRPGMVAVVQTSGDLGNWQPHLHALVSRGGWTAGGEWAPVPFVDEHSANTTRQAENASSLGCSC